MTAAALFVVLLTEGLEETFLQCHSGWGLHGLFDLLLVLVVLPQTSNLSSSKVLLPIVHIGPFSIQVGLLLVTVVWIFLPREQFMPLLVVVLPDNKQHGLMLLGQKGILCSIVVDGGLS